MLQNWLLDMFYYHHHFRLVSNIPKDTSRLNWWWKINSPCVVSPDNTKVSTVLLFLLLSYAHTQKWHYCSDILFCKQSVYL